MNRRVGLLVAAIAAVGVAPAFAQQPTTVTITPTSRTVVAGYSPYTITVAWCSFAPGMGTGFDIGSREVKVNGQVVADYDLTWDPAACGFTGNVADEQLFTSKVDVYLSDPPRVFDVTANVWGFGYLFSAWETFSLPEPRRGVRVVALSQFAEVQQGARTAVFSINNLGNRTDTFTLTMACSGAAVSGCSLTPAQVIAGAGQVANATVSYTAGASGTSGLIRLRADHYIGAWLMPPDSSWTAVTVPAPPSANVVIVGTSPGRNGYHDRGMCVTAAIGDDAAMECGDLRLVHALPSVRTLGRERTPTLLYNSQHVHPLPIVQADVTLPTSWGSLPATVTACLVINGGNYCTNYPGSQWGALGQTRRLSVGATGWSLAGTSLYAFNLQVTGSGGQSLPAVGGELPVVDRSSSPFGAGWWLAGLEEFYWLPDGRKMVVLGDGSVRVYALVGTNIYVAANPTRPDTLDGQGADYVRRLPNGGQVHFSAVTGRHAYTQDRLGYQTVFSWLGNCPSSIQVPGTSTSLTYSTTCSSGIVYSITAPSATGASRTVTLGRSGARLTSITEPGGAVVGFGYDVTYTNLVTSRVDRRGKVTSFAYGPGRRLAASTRPLAIVTTVAPAETRGLTAAQPLDSAYTFLDGPRADVSDVTRLWVNGYGAPTRVRDAAGRETRIRYSATWPGLADSVVATNGLSTRAAYNGRGLVTSTTVFNPNGDGQNATTSYQWHPSWNMVTSVRYPTGLFDTLVYDANGSRTFEQRTGLAVSYTYNGSKLLATAQIAGLPQEAYGYNTLGNLQSTTSPLGHRTLAYADGAGRDTLVISPRGTTAQASDDNWLISNGLRQSTVFDVAGRVIRSVTAAPAVTVPVGRSLPPDTIRLEQQYDAESNMLMATRYYSNNASGALYALTGSQWQYDDANRVSAQSQSGAGWTTFQRDAAGNDTAVVSARGLSVRTRFDALNRPTRRIVPQASYASSTCYTIQYHGWPCWYTFPTRDGPDVCIGVDTTHFDFDGAGNLRSAENGYAWVHRRYLPGGAVSHDTLFVRNYESRAPDPCGGGDRHAAARVPADFTPHAYGLRSTYDLLGRRTALYHPDGIDPCAGTCIQQSWYNATTGLLDSLRGPLGHVTRFSYDGQQRLVTTTHPGGATSVTTYDAESRVATRTGPGTSDQLARDATGRVTSASVLVGGNPRAIAAAYTGLGALAYLEGHAVTAAYEEFSVDALGNRQWILDNGISASYTARRRQMHHDVAGRLTHIDLSSCPAGVSCPSWYGFDQNTLFDASGNVTATYGYATQGQYPNHFQEYDETRSYYGADERLMVQNRHVGISIHSTEGGVYEEYRYDPLGRRILVRSRRTSPSCAPSPYQCGAYIERTVWDGDQVLYEIRSRGRDSTEAAVMDLDYVSGTGTEDQTLGSVAAVHAGGIDQPVQLIRMNAGGFPATLVVPHANWQGDYSYGTTAGGQLCTVSTCPAAPWPGDAATADGAPVVSSTGVAPWFGGLISGKADGSGLRYMRNRYYDPQTGRFTQQDPIGLAGGLNLYGFAGGDPVNFSDPFGLNPCLRSPGACAQSFVAGLQTIGRGLAAAGRFAASATRWLGDKWTALGQNLAARGAVQAPQVSAALQNKLNHIFGNPEHGLAGLADELGGQLQALRAIETATTAAQRAGTLSPDAEGLFTTSVQVGAQLVTVSGRVIEGVVRIGTAYVAKAAQ